MISNHAPAGKVLLESEYVGCYKERSPTGRSLPEDLGNSPQMTAFLCRERALAKKFKYYATQNGSKCFAGNADPRFVGASQGGCKAPCPGNPAFQCGGPDENMLYMMPVYVRELEGCFEATTTPPLLNAVTIANMTPGLCRAWAESSGFNYWGMQASSTCLGQYSFENLTNFVPTPGCNQPCAGDSSQACGGLPGAAAAVFRMITNDPEGGRDLCGI